MRDLILSVAPGQLREWIYDPNSQGTFLVVSVEGRTVVALCDGRTQRLTVGDVIIGSAPVSGPEHCDPTA